MSEALIEDTRSKNNFHQHEYVSMLLLQHRVCEYVVAAAPMFSLFLGIPIFRVSTFLKITMYCLYLPG